MSYIFQRTGFSANYVMSEGTQTRRGDGSSTAGFTHGSVTRHLLNLTGFMVMGFLAMNIARLAEAAFVGLLGTAELAAIAFNFPIVMGLGAAARGLGIGASSVVARAMGSGDRERSAVLVTHCLWLTLAFTLLCVAVGIPFAEPLFRSLGARGEVLPLTVDYFNVWILGLPMFALSMVGTSLLRATGDAKSPGFIQALGSILQIAFSPPLIFGWFGIPPLGVGGAALAHVLARVVSFGFTMYLFAFRDRLIVLTFDGLIPAWRSILHVGLPAAMTNLIGPASNAIIIRLLSAYGPAVVAGFGIAQRVDSIVAMVVVSLGGAAAPFIGQNWGAAQYDRVQQALGLSYRFCLAFGVFAAILMAVIGGPLVGLINDDPQVIETAAVFFLIVPFSIGFMGLGNVASSSFNALGKPIPVLVLAISRMIVVYIPMAILGGYLFGYAGIFGATAVANVINGVAAAYWNRITIRNAINELQASSASVKDA